MVHIQGDKMNKFIDKRKTNGPTGGITNYIAGWKPTLEPDGNDIFSKGSGKGGITDDNSSLCRSQSRMTGCNWGHYEYHFGLLPYYRQIVNVIQ